MGRSVLSREAVDFAERAPDDTVEVLIGRADAALVDTRHRMAS
jgi:hypothetical protein